MTMKYPERHYGCFTGTRERRRVAFLCDKEGPCSYCQSDYSDIQQHKTWAEAQAARELRALLALLREHQENTELDALNEPELRDLCARTDAAIAELSLD
jgi:hypothetical protein